MFMQISPDSRSASAGGSGPQAELALPPHKGGIGSIPIKDIVIAALVVVVIAIAAGSYILIPHTATSTTSISFTTTVGQEGSTTSSVLQSGLGGCSNITSPGSYNVNFRIKDVTPKGACINILASNVKISCGGNKLIGNGPFSAVLPFSYGIRISGASNVTVLDCQISNFSYGVASFSSSGVSVLASNISSNYMSNIYFNATTNSTVKDNYLTRSLSWQGGLFLYNGSGNNLIQNNTVSHNQFYGVNVSSGGETFSNNKVNGTGAFGFYCSPQYSYPIASKASGNTCFNNYGCAFLSCSGSNIPANISKIILSSTVMGCGTIVNPGAYQLKGNIQMKDYFNVSNGAALNASIPCISIKSGGVTLNCAGYGIYNSTYPIGIYNSVGSTVSNCKIADAAGYGILMISSPNSTVSNVTISKAALGGVLIQDTTFDNVTNSSVSDSGSGIVINNSQSDNLLSVNSSLNTYGLYVTGSSIGNNFYKITSMNNSNIDVYSDANLSGPQTQFVSGMTCGTTNAHWAPCKTFVQANLGYNPVTACASISQPGLYQLQTDLVSARDNCITIRASNVIFDCKNKGIQAGSASAGYGITIENASNVQVVNCTLGNFGAGGVFAYRTRNVNITSVGISGGATGIELNGSSNSTIDSSYVNGSSKYGILLTRVNYTNVRNNTLVYGPGASGIVINSSMFNTFLNNTVSQYAFGFSFTGHSNNNTFSNNTASVSSQQDYFCGSNNLGLNTEYGGIDFGASEVGCNWMALVQKVSEAPPCTAITKPDTFTLQYDYVYPYGATCFTVLSNASTINCNGHTVISTSGGVFAQVAKGTHGVLIENCFLKGFSTAIEDYNGSVEIYNNTIAGNGTSTGILVSGTGSGSILQNNVTGGKIAFGVYNALGEDMENNFAYYTGTGYYVYNSVAVKMANDYADSTTLYGLVLNATSPGNFRSLTLLGKSAGLECIGSSRNSTGMVDSGSNSCSSALNCTWLTSSSQSC